MPKKEEEKVLNPTVDENPDPRPEFVKNFTDAEVEQGPSDVAPEEGVVGQTPVFTPGVYAPSTSQLLPNAQRDAELIVADQIANDPAFEVKEVESLRAPGNEGKGLRDARDLAKLLEAHPHWVNALAQLDELEREAGVKNPAGWVKNPVDLYEEAKRHNFYFIGDNGNFR